MRDDDENSTTTKKGTADPLPLLPFTYAFCMVVSSMVLIAVIMVVVVVILYRFCFDLEGVFLFGYTCSSSCKIMDRNSQIRAKKQNPTSLKK